MKKAILFMLCMAIPFVCFGCSKNDDEITLETIETTTSQTETEETETEETTVSTYEVDTLTGISITWVDDSDLVVGEDFTVNEYNQIINFEDRYDACSFEYDYNGCISYISDTHKSDNTEGYEEFYYDNDVISGRYYNPNNFRSIQDSNITVTTNDDGQVIDLVETIEYTDSDDGSQSSGAIHYVINYDSEGRVSSADYYSNGDLDHTAYFTYDSNGNLIVYSCVGGDLGEFLRVELSYSAIEIEEPIENNIDAFTNFYNWVHVVTYII